MEILPYLGYESLFKEYRLDEPWDGPNNIKLLEKKMPPEFRYPNDAADSKNASYYVLTGPGTVFENEKSCRYAEIRDGSSNTLLIVEAKRDIPWTKPDDIAYDPEKPLPKLGGWSDKGFNAAFADGVVRFLPSSIDEKTLAQSSQGPARNRRPR